MGNETRTVYRLSEEFSSEFPVGYPDQYTPDDGQRA